MRPLTTWILAAVISSTPLVGGVIPRQIDVDCESEDALRRALARASKLPSADIHLHGVCVGNFVITGGNVTLRAATPDAGLAAPSEGSTGPAVLEIHDAQASLRGLSVEGGEVGVLTQGWDAEVLVYETDVHDQIGVGVYGTRGATVRVFESTVRDGFTGVSVQDDATLFVQHSVVSDLQIGVTVYDESFAGISETTIENNSEGGLNVSDRSDVNVLGGAFRNNGQVHVNANDWSSVTLLFEAEIGSETDTTTYSLSVNREAVIASYSTPALYGHVSALVGGSIRIGNTVVHGDLTALQFANAHVRNSEITGIVGCTDGSDVICKQTTTGGVVGCPSPSCGPAPEAVDSAPAVPEPPVIELPRFERSRQSRPQP
jgi:hypothetical protein